MRYFDAKYLLLLEKHANVVYNIYSLSKSQDADIGTNGERQQAIPKVFNTFLHFQKIGGAVMGRVSTKENKTLYQISREELGLSRERASERIGCLTADRIAKIESEECLPHPDEVLLMSKAYKKPRLCNYYCANACPIGQEHIPELEVKPLSQIILEMLASMNAIQKRKDRLVEIAVDGEITDDEIEDFAHIQDELEQISVAVETLKLWSENMMATGAIDIKTYKANKKKK